MTGPDGDSPPDLRELLKNPRLRPNDPKKKLTEYDWEVRLHELILKLSKQRKKKLLGSNDGGGIRINKRPPNSRPSVYQLLQFHNPGVVDPIPPANPIPSP